MIRTEYSRKRKFSGRWIAALAAVAVLSVAAPAAADTHDAERSGHPLRVLAYVVHPVGVIVDVLIFRPLHWLGNRQPIKTLFGHTAR